ncbi:MAG: AtpZ/AtpI family protein [Geodermatophilaceae bacterium]|jgi:F0F1-type ATP synthase assembly protein I|nr:AtpZ/AtpI family protein [Geodermatophilaceae bacterium]
MPDERNRSDISALLTSGMVIALCLVIGLGLGWFLDAAVGTTPVFLLIGLLLGVVAAGCYTVAVFRKQLRP